MSAAKRISNFNPNIPKRRRMATSKDGKWVVFVDQIFDPNPESENPDKGYADNPDKCFLWNERLKLKVELPCLDNPVDSFFKCILVSSCLWRDPSRKILCCYMVCFFNGAGYSWNSHKLDGFWEEESYPDDEDEDEFFVDAYISDGDHDVYDENISSRVFGLTILGMILGQNMRIQLPTTSLIGLRRFASQYDEEGNQIRVLLVERRPMCACQVWEIDLAQGRYMSVSNLDGVAIFIGDSHSTVYSCSKLKAGRRRHLEGNCIFVGNMISYEGNIQVYSLADKTLTVFENKPRSGFPVWFPSISNPGMPWLSFVEDDDYLEKITTSEDPGETAIEPSSCEDETCHDLFKVFLQLHPHLQSFVAESIHSPLDYANFRLVCKQWSELARPIHWLPNLFSSGSIEFPWLMISQENEACSSIIDPTCNVKYYKSNQELSGCKIRYSNDGWLLVTRGTREVFFIEPFTKTKIHLPNFPEDFDTDAISFSSSPTSSDWVIVSIVYLSTKYRLMYLKPVDNKWRIVDCELEQSGCLPSWLTMVFHDHKFYCLNRDGNLTTFWWEADVLKHSTINQSINREEEAAFKKLFRGYLVSCERSLYLVVVGFMGKFVEVFRWDVGASKWTRIETLGRYSFFVCKTSTLALPVSEKSKQSTINFPVFVEDHHLSYKLDASEFRCSNGDISACNMMSLYERKELLNATWLHPKLIRGYNYR